MPPSFGSHAPVSSIFAGSNFIGRFSHFAPIAVAAVADAATFWLATELSPTLRLWPALAAWPEFADGAVLGALLPHPMPVTQTRVNASRVIRFMETPLPRLPATRITAFTG